MPRGPGRRRVAARQYGRDHRVMTREEIRGTSRNSNVGHKRREIRDTGGGRMEPRRILAVETRSRQGKWHDFAVFGGLATSGFTDHDDLGRDVQTWKLPVHLQRL